MKGFELILIFPTLKNNAILRSAWELNLMVCSVKSFTFFYHGDSEFYLGLNLHLAVTGNSPSHQPSQYHICKASSIIIHASPALGHPLLPPGRQRITVMSDNWTELPGAPATLVLDFVCLFFLSAGWKTMSKPSDHRANAHICSEQIQIYIHHGLHM